MKHPAEVVPADVLLWRDRLRAQRKSAATVAFKPSVVRSFFEYLKAAGAISLNPASTKLVSPPELPSEPAGRALSPCSHSSRSPQGDTWKLFNALEWALTGIVPPGVYI